MLFSPNTDVVHDIPAADPGTQTPAKADPTPETPGTVPATPSPTPGLDLKAIQELIKADRETQERLSKESQERESYKARAEKAEKALQEFEKAKANAILDPAGYLRKTLGYTDRELALTSEGIMFTLLPDKADPGHRARLIEAQMMRDREAQARKEEESKSAQVKAAEEAAANQQKDLEARYSAHLKANVATFQPGAYPASQAWFGQDHDKYTEMLFSTARDMAEAAQRAGGKADLTPASVAKVVEQTLSERAKRWSGLAQPAQTPQPKVAAPAEPNAEVAEGLAQNAESQGLLYSPGKSKTAKFASDEDRLRRAAAVAFK